MESAKPLVKKFRKPSPLPSPAGFTWPARNDPSARKRFAVAVNEVLKEQGRSNMSDICAGIYGRARNAEGYLAPRNMANFSAWLKGKKFPREEGAAYLAQYLGVPLARLVSPRGKGAPAKTNGNGSAGHPEVAVSSPMPRALTVAAQGVADTKAKAKAVKRGPDAPAYKLLPLPPGAERSLIELKTFKGYPHFMKVMITGVVQVEIAQTLLAILSPEAPAADEDEHS